MELIDWTMVGNANDPFRQVMTLVYLFKERYECDPTQAARWLADDTPGNPLRTEVIANAREELASRSGDLGIPGSDDEESRAYLRGLLSAYDDLTGTAC